MLAIAVIDTAPSVLRTEHRRGSHTVQHIAPWSVSFDDAANTPFLYYQKHILMIGFVIAFMIAPRNAGGSMAQYDSHMQNMTESSRCPVPDAV
jgi:hypothetical protein